VGTEATAVIRQGLQSFSIAGREHQPHRPRGQIQRQRTPDALGRAGDDDGLVVEGSQGSILRGPGR